VDVGRLAVTATLSYDAIVRGLVAQGVPLDRAEASARRELSLSSILPEQQQTAQEIPDVIWPVRLVIPWSALVTDNAKFRAAIRGAKPCMVILQPYAQARQRIAQLAQLAMNGSAPVSVPLAFVGRVFMPSQRRIDPSNCAKLVQDALNKIVYADDAWLYDVRWLNAGVDVDAPRAEITIEPTS
jgi:Holliday junction resolvase RusA-like endonuclease